MSALAAAGPSPALGDKPMLFGQFVGDWEFDATWYARDARSGPRAANEASAGS